MRKTPGKSLILSAIAAGVCSFATHATAQDLENRSTLCRINKEVRTLRIEKGDGKCKTSYTKFGKDQVIGEAQNMSSCEEVLKKVQDTLEAAGWKCREMKESTVSHLSETMQ